MCRNFSFSLFSSGTDFPTFFSNILLEMLPLEMKVAQNSHYWRIIIKLHNQGGSSQIMTRLFINTLFLDYYTTVLNCFVLLCSRLLVLAFYNTVEVQ